MIYSESQGHSVTMEVNSDWQTAFSFLENPSNLGKWALGCMNVEATERDGIYSGTSIFNGGRGLFKIEAHRNLRLIDFHVGNESTLIPRISIRLVPGPYYGNTEQHCLVTLDAWRDLQMSDERWHQLCSCHETEIFLLKALIQA